MRTASTRVYSILLILCLGLLGCEPFPGGGRDDAPDSLKPGETFFAWDDVDAARNDRQLQSQYNADNARREHGRGVKCPCCSRSAKDLTWFYFSSPAWTWQALCGRAGWMAVCDRCHQQVAFFCEIMN